MLGRKIDLPPTIKTSPTGKIHQYDADSLLDWRGLLGRTGTALFDRRSWIVVVYCSVLAFGTALTLCLLVPGAQRMDRSLFDRLVDYFEVFISLLLAMYMGNCYMRWSQAVSCFKCFLSSIKTLMYTLRAVGVRQELVEELERLTVASCYVLEAEVHCMQQIPVASRVKRWKASVRAIVKKKLLTRDEQREMVRGYDQHAELIIGIHSTMIWTWVGQVMRKMRGENSVTPPMYVRLLFLCQDCLKEVEELKKILMVQFPFIYCHMLCASVHLANILVAIKCGISLGIPLECMVSAHSLAEAVRQGPSLAAMNECREAARGIPVTLLFLSIKPLLYQTVLVMAHSMCYPYGDEPGDLPTEIYIKQMELDLGILGIGSHRQSSIVRGAPPPVRPREDDEDDDICCLEDEERV